MKTKIMSLIIIAAASTTFAGQPVSISDLAKNSRKATTLELETKGSGYVSNAWNSASKATGKAIMVTYNYAKNTAVKAETAAYNYVKTNYVNPNYLK